MTLVKDIGKLMDKQAAEQRKPPAPNIAKPEGDVGTISVALKPYYERNAGLKAFKAAHDASAVTASVVLPVAKATGKGVLRAAGWHAKVAMFVALFGVLFVAIWNRVGTRRGRHF